MKKAAGVAITAAAVGTALMMAYSSMKPGAKRQLKNEFRDTFHHMDDVKQDLCEVRQDMMGMARTMKDQI